MATIPMDIVDDLFLRLPATALVRFRLLSKPCFSLIEKPDFVASHLKRTLETGDNLMILLRGPRGLRTFYLESPDKVSDVEHPLQTGGSTEVFGSCNGLVGLVNSPVEIALFNPSTRKIFRLPFECVDFPESTITPEHVFYGLGYDSVNDDYKVVRMAQSKRDPTKSRFRFPLEIKVFSLKRNSWKEIYLRMDVQVLFVMFYYHLLYRRGNAVLASNCLHWVLPRGRGIAFNAIVSFDLAADDLGITTFPMKLRSKDNLDIGVLDGLLCLMCYELSHVDIWVCTEYKGYDSYAWTKQFKVPKPEDVESFEHLRPLMYSKDKTKILMEINNAKNLMWFDLESETFTKVGIKDCDIPYSAEILVSSLVLGCNGDLPKKEARAGGDKVTQKGNKKGGGFLSKGFKLKL
ncbi:unnamed protein product [Arabis nemorensis]|uniref:F-box domain-containing protein n=1 Tax=Arabis nemorensis TaxID=586526 RepID=A0A565CVG9_9BRAS|nr:unnamed protein product [Arabis nemorensis]